MSVNPLKQYFRRPSIYIQLPSNGLYYKPDVVEFPDNRELPVYPMTAIDEITAKTPDALYNGQAVVDIIHSCVPNIKNAWDINTLDFDTILIGIRIASVGDTMEISSKCPSCSEDSSYDINLVELLQQQERANYNIPLKLGELSIKFKPLTYKQTNENSKLQFELQKTVIMVESESDDEQRQKIMQESILKFNSYLIDLIVEMIEYIETPEQKVDSVEFIKEFLINCDRTQHNYVIDYGKNLGEKSKLKPINLRCMHCEHQYDHRLVLNITDFFD